MRRSERKLSALILSNVLLVCLHAAAQTVTVDATPSHVVNRFSPLYALGSTVDRVPSNATDVFFRPDQIEKVLSAGWGVISYRQNTDLFVQAWHWNPKGSWSDPAGKGYFTGEATPTGEMIRHSYGYSLPHRGFTRNGGTELDGYSRLDDGDAESYWKSNPYLASQFTGENDSLHPQWVVIALDKKEKLNAIRIQWSEPFARDFQVQYWLGDGDAMDEQDKGAWRDFPSGAVTDGNGGDRTLLLSPSPVTTKFVRIWMTRSSNTCDSHGSADRRNCVGYAIRELYLGTMNERHEFKDLLHHSPDQKQTLTLCSSVDPWHQSSDLYLAPDRMESGDQPGFDLFFTSGITRGLPAIVPVALLYSTPEDAAAQMSYIKQRGYPVSYIEMGEEADGQYMLPEDYGALYLQFADALHRVDPGFKLGGPSFQGVPEDIKAWPDAQGATSWLRRFLDYLRAHNRLQDLSFMSFEHYPYEPCKISWSSLYDEPTLVSQILQVWRNDGVPASVPMIISESNIAWNTGESFVDIFGALWLADYFGAFFTAGGNAIYYFHYIPTGLHPGCNESMGTFGMWTADANYEIGPPTSQFFASQLINLEWVQPGTGVHRVFPATADIQDTAGHELVTAYA